MGVPKKHRLGICFFCCRKECIQSRFHCVLMPMGHEEPNAADGVAHNFRQPRITAKAVAISRHLMKYHIGVLLRHCRAVIVMIAQMHHMVRLDLLNAQPHKAESAMGI